MYEYIEGKIVEINPTYVVIDAGGIGYFINISLTTFESIKNIQQTKLFIHQIVREDAHLLFGFEKKFEREIFRLLISVSGVGASTGRMMLSSLTPDTIQNAIRIGDVNLLQSIKGIGAKTAQRIIVELKDKMGIQLKSDDLFLSQNNTLRDQALSALVMLGFSKINVEKVLNRIMGTKEEKTVENLIKRALKEL